MNRPEGMPSADNRTPESKETAKCLSQELDVEQIARERDNLSVKLESMRNKWCDAEDARQAALKDIRRMKAIISHALEDMDNGFHIGREVLQMMREVSK